MRCECWQIKFNSDRALIRRSSTTSPSNRPEAQNFLIIITKISIGKEFDKLNEQNCCINIKIMENQMTIKTECNNNKITVLTIIINSGTHAIMT